MATQLVIFGASGDLTARKLLPALLGAIEDGEGPGSLQVIGVSRRARSDESWRAMLDEALAPEHAEAWRALRPRLFWQPADATDPATMQGLGRRLDALAEGAGTASDRTGRLFYLALSPGLFAPTVQGLGSAGLLRRQRNHDGGFRRVVVEKPFGVDLTSAQRLNRDLKRHLHEDQLYRIDHYLGKETVQNILGFRFQNAIFEPLWNRNHVESVEISVCETVGMEGGRGAYYDGAGALRDMVQNHVLQLLALVAMEPPGSMRADAIRDEKVKVLQALTPFTPDHVASDVVRAQYTTGGGALGYADEAGVAAGSTTETYVAIRAGVHNWRWNGVPFLLRTGKRMDRRYSEVILRFRVPPLDLLNGPVFGDVCALRPNALRLLIQPTEGIRLDFLVKQPGSGTVMRPATLGFDYADLAEGSTAPAYQRLLVDVLDGNPTLFIRDDEVEAAWRFVDGIRAGWADAEAETPVHTYAAGSGGPRIADDLFRGCEGIWGDGRDE